MKNTILILFSAILLLASCSKKDNTNSSGGEFIINGTSYKITSSNKLTSSNLIWFNFVSLDYTTFANSAVNFYFSGTTIPAAGVYNIRNSSVNLGSNEVYVLATSTTSSSSTTQYESIGTGTVQVSVNSGKVAIKMNNTPMTNATVSADVSEM